MKTLISTLMTVLLWGAFPTSAMADECTPAFPGAVGCQVTVNQGWDSEKQNDFWFTGQGSNIIPYGWFLNLEQANNADLFRDPSNINFYGYLPQNKQGPESLNPDGLPIGFTKDDTFASGQYRKISKKWLGLTCAACHTGQLEYKGRTVLIDGAPAMADFQSFFEDMTTAMRATLNNPEKFMKFAAKVAEYNRKNNEETTDESTLKKHLIVVTEIFEKRNVWNSGKIRFGNARLDALGSILNQVLVAHELPLKEGLVNAPVSYPFIWDTPQLDLVQWNGSVSNAGLGAVGRNIGEVIGVFGSLNTNRDITNGTPVPDYQNSVNIVHLGKLEDLIWYLNSPKWEDVWDGTDLSTINTHLKEFGKRIYAKKCIGCHALPIDRDKQNSKYKATIKATMISIGYVGTDPTAAVNFVTRRDSIGDIDLDKSIGKILKGSVAGVLIHELQKNKRATLITIKAGQPTDVQEIITDLANKILKGDETGFSDNKRIMSADFFRALKDKIDAREMRILKKRKQEQRQYMQNLKAKNQKLWEKLTEKLKEEKCEPPLCYKARPLNGVWATGPYLHNGSVRTIRQLLIPSERETKFRVGSRRFDPEGMGFIDAGNFVMNTTLEGNFNTGHEFFGTDFKDDNDILLGLLEYLKTL